jgi:hypothetical protein
LKLFNSPKTDLDLKALLWAEIGGAVMVAGVSTALLTAFDGSLAGAFAGYMITFGGFRLAQVGSHHSLSDVDLFTFRRDRLKLEAKRITGLCMGAALMAYGTGVLARAIEIRNISSSAAAGLLLIAGYIVAHYGMNNEVI